MSNLSPTTTIDLRYGAPEAEAESWEAGLDVIQAAPIYWISTVSADGQPHVTPLIAVWHEDALWFCTGMREEKAKNLAVNPARSFTTGTNAYDAGLDVVLRGRAVREMDRGVLEAIAAAYLSKYGEDWRFEVVDGGFRGDGGPAEVFRVAPEVVHGFRRGSVPSQTRWAFS